MAAFSNGTEHHADSRDVSAVGFEPTSANTVELESTPLDRSGTLTLKGPQMPQLTNHSRQLYLSLYVPQLCISTSMDATTAIAASIP